MIKEIKDNLVEQTLLNQSILELLIDKKLITKEEVEDRLRINLELFYETAREYAKLIHQTKELQKKVDIDEEFIRGIYFGPTGKA
jgi:hypothetical protein